jgi:hypothetical protein
MAISFLFRRMRLAAEAGMLVLLVVSGCQETERIHTYSVPKETRPEVTQTASAKPKEPTDRMLAAIIPVGDQAWFFKVVGPIVTVDKHEKELKDFFAAVRFGDDGKPKWQLPAGWTEAPGGNAMRLATITVPNEGKPLEITVNALPWSGTPADLLSNINRWRGQLQLSPIGADQVAESTREAKAGDRPMTIVDLRGNFAGSGMAAPFAARSSAPDLPPGHPPIDASGATAPGSQSAAAGPSAATTDKGESTMPTDRMLAAIVPDGDRAWFFKVVGSVEAMNKRTDEINKFFESIRVGGGERPGWTLPADWKEEQGTGMRAATIRIPEGKATLEMSVIALPWRGTAADVLSNVNRWRGQMTLADAREEDLKEFAHEIKTQDGKGTMMVVDLRGHFKGGMTPPFAGARDGNK